MGYDRRQRTQRKEIIVIMKQKEKQKQLGEML